MESSKLEALHASLSGSSVNKGASSGIGRDSTGFMIGRKLMLDHDPKQPLIRFVKKGTKIEYEDPLNTRKTFGDVVHENNDDTEVDKKKEKKSKDKKSKRKRDDENIDIERVNNESRTGEASTVEAENKNSTAIKEKKKKKSKSDKQRTESNKREKKSKKKKKSKD